MKSIVLKSKGHLILEEKAVPTPASNDCLVKVRSIGICNSDLLRAFEGGAYYYPSVMGHEFAGEIVTCGVDVKSRKEGEKVAVFPLLPCFQCVACREKLWVHCNSYQYYGSRCDGGFTEYIAIKEWNLLPLPAGCDIRFAGLTEPLAVAVHTAALIPPEKKGKLLVMGAGFIGLSIAKLVEKSGHFDEIWLLDRNAFKLELADKFGYKTALMDNDKTMTSCGKAFDVVVEACGAVPSFKNSIRFCKDLGLLLWTGNIHGDLVLSQKEVSSILRKELTLQGVWNSNYQPEGKSDWTQALDVIAKEAWIGDLVTHFASLSEGIRLIKDLYRVKKEGNNLSYLKACLLV